jgi:hypothetical protein
MTVCPRCGFPHPGTLLSGSFDTTCTRCDWRGTTDQLLEVDPDKVFDPRQLDKFYTFLHSVLSVAVGRQLRKLGIHKGDKPEDVEALAHLLQKISNIIMKEVLETFLGKKKREYLDA